MVSEHARRTENDSSSIEESCSQTTDHNSKSNDSNSRRSDFHQSLSSSLSTKTQRSDPLQLSLVDSPHIDDPRKKENGRGRAMTSTDFNASSSSVASSGRNNEKGERFKRLLDLAFTKVVAIALASVASVPSRRELDQEVQQEVQQSPPVVGKEVEVLPAAHQIPHLTNGLSNSNGNILQKLVQEKHTKCLALQQNIDAKDSEIAQLEIVVENLRESKKVEAGNLMRLRIALKRACDNATSARYEANKVEAHGAALTAKVQAFKKVVQETKRTSALLLQEQEELGFGVEGMENKFIQLQAKLASHSASKQHLQHQNRDLTRQLRDSKNRMDDFQDALENEQSECVRMKRKYKELEETTRIQEGQRERLQDDLDSAQTLLVDSTTTAAESKHAMNDCKQTIDRLEEANQYLHQQLQKQQATSRKQEASHQHELNRAKKDHQEIQLQLSNQKEMYRTLKLEKLAADKRQESQAAKIFALERRLKDTTNLITSAVPVPSNFRDSNVSNSANGCSIPKEDCTLKNFGNPSGQPSSKTMCSFAVPHLLKGKNNPLASQAAGVKKCSICFKDSSGLMKKCECGRKGCQFRAHAKCVQQRLIGARSHIDHVNNTQQPPRPTVILCRSASARGSAAQKNTITTTSGTTSSTTSTTTSSSTITY